MRSRRMILLALLGSTVATTFASAEDVQLFQTDRPDLTEGAARVGRNAWQLEAGWSFASGAGPTAHSLGDGLLRIGVDDHVELRFFAPSLQWSSTIGARHDMFSHT